MIKLKEVKAFTFDTGGTILDWHSGFRRGFEFFKKKNSLSINCAELANEFRRRSLKIVTNQDKNNLKNFDEAHKIAIEDMLLENNIVADNDDKKYLYYEAPAKLLSWSDFLEPFNNSSEVVSINIEIKSSFNKMSSLFISFSKSNLY